MTPQQWRRRREIEVLLTQLLNQSHNSHPDFLDDMRIHIIKLRIDAVMFAFFVVNHFDVPSTGILNYFPSRLAEDTGLFKATRSIRISAS